MAFEEGICLIYDQRVMRTISGGSLLLPDDIWGETRRLLGPPVRHVPQGRHWGLMPESAK